MQSNNVTLQQMSELVRKRRNSFERYVLTKRILKDIIHGEDKSKPYSDATLVKKLADREVSLSRRGVAKYREALGIKGSFDRREIS